MNLDAALVMRVLEREEAPRTTSKIAKLADIPRARVEAALRLLHAVGKAEPNENGHWRKAAA